MSFIEHLEGEGWQAFLQRTFDYTLQVLETDRFRQVGSAVDDLRAWLVVGGAGRARQAIEDEMADRRFASDHRQRIAREVDRLLADHRFRLMVLVAKGTIAATAASAGPAIGLGDDDLADLVARIEAGERPFEDRMRAIGRSEAEITAIYALVDAFFARIGLRVGPPAVAPRWVH